jgi:DNA-binding NtrC family response regulator
MGPDHSNGHARGESARIRLLALAGGARCSTLRGALPQNVEPRLDWRSGMDTLIHNTIANPQAEARIELVVIEQQRTSVVLLPRRGQITIGRTSGQDLCLPDDRVSERHGSIDVDGGRVEIVDDGSTNGTEIGGRVLRGERAPWPLDEVVKLGDARLLLRREQPRRAACRVFSHQYFMARLEEECDRAAPRGRFALARLKVPLAVDQLAKAIAPEMSGRDVVALYGGTDYEILLLGATADEARRRAEALRTRLGRTRCQIAVACFPADGSSGAELVRAASDRLHGAATPHQALCFSEVMKALHQRARRIAESQAAAVLILGESGTGKELLARFIHAESGRRQAPWRALNCAAVPSELAESELFGHWKGAFSGATDDQAGLFEAAHEGTVFLDEIGELPPALQPKLLRFLQEREVQRLGAGKRPPIAVDVRVIAATNRDLARASSDQGFRADLFHRLTFVLVIPPLRERREEIAPLARAFIDELVAREGRGTLTLSDDAIVALERYPWPGNVRELRNVIERAVVLCDGDLIEPDDLELPRAAGPAPVTSAPPAGESLATLSPDEARRRIVRALLECGCVKREAAQSLGITIKTLHAWMDRLEMARPKRPPE